MKPSLRAIEGEFCVHRLPGEAPLPAFLQDQPWTWVARTPDELSVICRPNAALAAAAEVSPGWTALKVAGPIEHTVVGLLADLCRVLAAESIALFALSTFDTDYLLVQASELERAFAALGQAGYPAAATLPAR